MGVRHHGPRVVGRDGFGVEFLVGDPGAANDRLLIGQRQGFEGGQVVNPFLEQDCRAARTRLPGRVDRDLNRLIQCRILGAIHKPDRIAVVERGVAPQFVRAVGDRQHFA